MEKTFELTLWRPTHKYEHKNLFKLNFPFGLSLTLRLLTPFQMQLESISQGRKNSSLLKRYSLQVFLRILLT